MNPTPGPGTAVQGATGASLTSQAESRAEPLLRVAPAAGADGVIRVHAGDEVHVNAAQLREDGPSVPRLVAEWGDDTRGAVSCGACRLSHSYAPGRYTLTATVSSVTQTWIVEAVSGKDGCRYPAPYITSPDAVPGQIVVYKDLVDVDAETDRLQDKYGFVSTFRYQFALLGFAATLSDDVVQQMRCEPTVRYIQQDTPVSLASTPR